MPHCKKKNGSEELELPFASAPSEETARFLLISRVLIILIAGLFVFSPTIHGQWLWDDDQEVTVNRGLRTFAGLRDFWSGKISPDYFPLKSTFLWIQYQLWQLNSTGYHLVTIGFHLANALLVWRLFHRLNISMAWIGGLLFCIHPIVVESVAWISEQKNTISQFFLLSALLVYLKFDENRTIKNYLLAAILFIAAALCKTAVIMLPCTLLLYIWWKRSRITKNDILSSIPFFAISLILGLLTIWFQFHRAIGHEGIPVGGFFSRLALAGMNSLFYITKCILPIDLMPIYPRWEVDSPTWIQFIPGLLILAGIFYFYKNRATWGRDMLFGFGFFLINLIPVMGFVTMSYMRITWAADHFVYLPLIGVLGLICGGIGRFYYAMPMSRRPFWEVVAFSGVALLVYTSFSYASIFVNEEVMWSYNLKHNSNAWQAHSRSAMKQIHKGDYGAAYSHLMAAVQLRPDLAEIRNNLGVILQKWNRTEEATERFREARDRATWEPTYWMNLANSLITKQQYSEAMPIFGRLVKMMPTNSVMYCNYGATLYMMGFREEAIAQLKKALELNPQLESARTNLQAVLSAIPGGELQFLK